MSRLEKIRNKNSQPTAAVYSRTEQENNFNFKNKLILFFIIILFGALIYLLLFSSLFKIKEFDTVGYRYPEMITEIAKEEASKNIFTRNIIFFNSGFLRNKLLGDSRIEDIIIKKSWPPKIIIQVKEAEPALIWMTAGDKLLIDDRGFVIGQAGNEKLITISDAANIKASPGERVASPTFIKFIKLMSDGFEVAASTKIAKITIFDLLTDVHITAADGWTVYLDATKDPESSLKNLTKVLEEARKTGKAIEYIDMRLDNRIFYK